MKIKSKSNSFFGVENKNLIPKSMTVFEEIGFDSGMVKAISVWGICANSTSFSIIPSCMVITLVACIIASSTSWDTKRTNLL